MLLLNRHKEEPLILIFVVQKLAPRSLNRSCQIKADQILIVTKSHRKSVQFEDIRGPRIKT